MTDIQVKYWVYREDKRHNLVSEGINQGTLNESVRHNVRTEDISLLNLSELNRHNVQTEQVAWKNAASQEVMANASTMQATASMIQAGAAQRQAAAAESQAASAAIRANADAAYTTSKTVGQNVSNLISQMTIPANVVSPYVNITSTIVKSTTDVFNTAGNLLKFAK